MFYIAALILPNHSLMLAISFFIINDRTLSILFKLYNLLSHKLRHSLVPKIYSQNIYIFLLSV